MIWTARSAIRPTASLAKYFAAEGASRSLAAASVHDSSRACTRTLGDAPQAVLDHGADK